jgi:hypothetical protein
MVLAPPVPVQACAVIAFLFIIPVFTYQIYKLSYLYSGHDSIWRSGGTVPFILKFDIRMSDERHAKTVESLSTLNW